MSILIFMNVMVGGLGSYASEEETHLAKGIDVSVWNAEIDWNEVYKEVDFAMLRAGYGKSIAQKDKRFEENYTGAKEVGLDCGVYWYSYATTPNEARQEALACLQIVDGRQLEYPIAFDIEEESHTKLSKQELQDITTAFCETIEQGGYYVSICTYENFFENYDKDYLKKYDTWIANYNNQPTLKYGIWQYSCKGSVGGISTNVDMNYVTKDYEKIMRDNHLNGF